MGTRHLIAVVLDGEFKVAQYGQWDGYPSGQGVELLAFLRNVDLPTFTERVRTLRWVNEADAAAIARRWIVVGADESGFVTMSQADEFYSTPPFAALNRDVGAKVLTMIDAGQVEYLRDDSAFALDSLFCEWAYVIDLTAATLEVYEGFQRAGSTITGRWAGQKGDGEYEPVSLVATYPLADLPSDEDFVAENEGEEA